MLCSFANNDLGKADSNDLTSPLNFCCTIKHHHIEQLLLHNKFFHQRHYLTCKVPSILYASSYHVIGWINGINKRLMLMLPCFIHKSNTVLWEWIIKWQQMSKIYSTYKQKGLVRGIYRFLHHHPLLSSRTIQHPQANKRYSLFMWML